MRPIRYTATAADVTAGNTPPLIVDIYTPVNAYGIQYLLAAGNAPGTGSVQQTFDDPYNPPALGLTWDTVVLDANGRAVLADQPVRAFQVSTPVAGDVITIVAQGVSV